MLSPAIASRLIARRSVADVTHTSHPSSAICGSGINLALSLSDATTTPTASADLDLKPSSDSAAAGIPSGIPNGTEEKNKTKPPPSFLSALWGIATSGSPWEYMLRLRSQGYDGVVPIDLGPAGAYNFLLSPESVRSATVEEASSLPRRFSVPLFETLELDRGLVYEQGERHRRHKKLCIPSFEQTASMEAFVGATRSELDDVARRFRGDCRVGGKGEGRTTLDLYAEMRRATLNVVLAVTFGLGSGGGGAGGSETTFRRADELSRTIGEWGRDLALQKLRWA